MKTTALYAAILSVALAAATHGHAQTAGADPVHASGTAATAADGDCKEASCTDASRHPDKSEAPTPKQGRDAGKSTQGNHPVEGSDSGSTATPSGRAGAASPGGTNKADTKHDQDDNASVDGRVVHPNEP